MDKKSTSKRAILDLQGDLASRGLNVTLKIHGRGDSSPIQSKGTLPAAPDLVELLRSHWEEKYRKLGPTRALSPKKIHKKGLLEERVRECRESAKQLRDRFQRWLNSEGMRSLENSLRSELDREDEIQFVIATDDDRLQKLPWCEWDLFETYRYAEVALSSPEFDELPGIQTEARSYVRILAILGNDKGIDVESDRAFLNKLPQARVTFLVKPDRHQVNDRLWEESWDILFFAGHSCSEGDTGRIYLNDTDSLTVDELWHGLRKMVDGGLRLAIFNSCDGLGLARRLDDLCIPQMVVMRERTPDRVAQDFLRYFLAAFAIENRPFHLAVRQARERLQGLEAELPCATWLPTICQHQYAQPPIWSNLYRSAERKAKTVQPKSIFQVDRKGITLMGSLLLACLGGGLLLGPRISDFFNDRGIKQYRNNRLQHAKIYYQLAIGFNPFNHKPYYNLGWQCEQQFHDIPCAQKYYQKSMSLGSSSARASYIRSLLLHDRDLTKALKIVEEGLPFVKYKGDEASLLKSRGWIFFEQNRWEAARKDFEDAIELAEDSPHTYCLLAQTLEKLARFEEAKLAWEKTLVHAENRIEEQASCIALAEKRLKGDRDRS
ncbi:MAG: CHAT domain-containing protein [Cyanobacteriota bacterium]|nr:CHAT domain-containing protein [Cyanobacteriota bacterium]